MFRIRMIAFVCCVALLFSFGCSGNAPRAKLTGKVTYKGQPVKGGTMLFQFENGQVATALAPDGTYSLSDLPLGQVRVSIETETYNPAGTKPVYGRAAAGEADARNKQQNSRAVAAGKAPEGGAVATAANGGLGGPNAEELAKLYVKIPPKYTNEKTSGLLYDVVQGVNTKDFELTD